MTRMVRVHFDGKVLVPEEPVDLPLGQSLNIQVLTDDAVSAEEDSRPLMKYLRAAEQDQRHDDGLPTDLAAQHDHYLYGTPRKP